MRKGIIVLLLLSLMIPAAPFAWGQDDPTVESEETPPAPEDTEGEATEEPTFAINGYRVEGNTVLPSDKVNEIVSAHAGPSRRFEDVEKARVELEAAYREAGYPTVLVIVPEQTIEGGIVKLEVVESKLGQVEIIGNEYFMQSYILDRLPSLRPGALLYEPTVMQELNRISANPDLKVTPVLSVGEIPGTVDLKLQVKERLPLHAALEWNNRGTPNTPRQRLSGTIQYNNLFDRDHIITFQTTQTPQTPQDWGEVSSYSLSYVIPRQRRGHMIAAYVAVSDSNSVLDGSSVPDIPGDINTAGNATVFGGRYIFPLFEKEGASDQLSLGIDYKRLGRNEVDFEGDPGAPPLVLTPHVYYAPLSVAYTGSRFDEGGTTRFSASVRGYVAGTVPGGDEEDFAGDPDEDPLPNREGSSGTFAVLQAGIERSQPLPEGFVFSGKFDGQLASEPLISSEQYFAGGIDSVRGYLENEALGDDAVHWTLEVFTPSLPEVLPPEWKQNLRFSVFYDAAYLWIRETPPGQIEHYGLAGYGFGMRLGLTDYVQFRVDHAWAARNAVITEEKDWFTHFLLRAAF